MLLKLIIAIPLALFVDLIDYFPLAYLTPGVLQAVDIVSAIVFFVLIGPLGLVAIFDLIPFIGLIPFLTILVITRWIIYLGLHK